MLSGMSKVFTVFPPGKIKKTAAGSIPNQQIGERNVGMISPDQKEINIQLLRGAYSIKRIFQTQKTSETKQMLIRFLGLEKGLFRLFCAFSAIMTVLFATTTVLMYSALGTSRRLGRS